MQLNHEWTQMNTNGNSRHQARVGASLADARNAQTTGVGKQRPYK
jgi:hypothetical protein